MVTIYALKKPTVEKPKLKVTYRTIQPKLNLVLYRPEGAQAFRSLEKTNWTPSMEQERAKTFMSLVKTAHDLRATGNINVQTGLKDLMQMLGYTAIDRLEKHVTPQDFPQRNNYFMFIRRINRW